MNYKISLDKLNINQKARIIGFDADSSVMETRLREIGFAEGDLVQIIHKGLFGGSPLAIRLDGLASIAIRPKHAKFILVEKLTDQFQDN